ncbi:MAG: hypothetical protein IRY89_12425 [Pseudolabrys sp.]|nr:hypothetical protein [Pseudolabrys sp.]
MPRAIALVIATTFLAACATARSDRPAGVVCPPVPVYSKPFLKRAADELDCLPAGSAIEQMISDYRVIRDQARACQRK